MLRISKPELVTTITAIATSAAVNVERSLPCDLLDFAAEWPPLSEPTTSTFQVLSAGASPNRIPVRTETAKLNTMTVRSRPASSSRGILYGEIRTSTGIARQASPIPANPPSRERIRLNNQLLSQ